jgi:flagellar protein FliT
VPDMLSSRHIITLYDAMSAITVEMLAAARAEDWELLAILESRCAAHVQTLKDQEPLQALSGPEREQKVNIIQKMLADDREIRKLTELRMAQLSTLMHSANAERKLSEAYGA